MRFETIANGVRVFAPAKVNLYLEVLGLRPDRFHEVETVIQAISLFDEIEFHLEDAPGIRLHVLDPDGGASALGAGEDNLVVRAARMLEPHRPVDAGRAVGLGIVLTKRIPMGAGLGGGSSDAAATLLALNRLWGTHRSLAELQTLAGALGSDVPFFCAGGAALCFGRGEKVRELAEPVRPWAPRLVLVYPEMHIPTPLIYKELDRLDGLSVGLTSPGRLTNMPPELIWFGFDSGEFYFNRLESVVRRVFPGIEGFFSEMAREPFHAVLLSGSGSALYGVCRQPADAELIAERLRGRISARVFVVDPVHRWAAPV